MNRSWQIRPPTIIFGARGVDDPRASQPPQASCTSVWPPMPAVLDPPQRDPSKKHITSREELGRTSERKQKYLFFSSLPTKGGWESPPGRVRRNKNKFSLDFGKVGSREGYCGPGPLLGLFLSPPTMVNTLAHIGLQLIPASCAGRDPHRDIEGRRPR